MYKSLLGIEIAALAIILGLLPVAAQAAKLNLVEAKIPDIQAALDSNLLAQPPTKPLPDQLPTPQSHPLPPTLSQWRDPTNSGDYFPQVKTTNAGYLVWSQFPIKVYVEPSLAIIKRTTSPSPDHSQEWVNAVLEAVREWSVYLPVQVVNQQEVADIAIWRSAPPIQVLPSNPEASHPQPANRIRSAETRYELYVSQSAKAPAILSHRCIIWLRPNQTVKYIQAAARHELGHALGIWGHSPSESDVMYFSQVRNPPAISPRDINTLKRIYEQPTRLGWPLLTSRRVDRFYR